MKDLRPADDDAIAPALDAITFAILDGSPVDWTSAVDPSLAGVSGELRLVADLAAVHRSLADQDADRASLAPGFPWRVGQLTLTSSLGRGTFGEVFRAWDNELHRDVAVKVLFSRRAGADDASRMRDEGRLLARVRHPNVVSVYGVQPIDGRTGLVTEFIHGRTLAGVVSEFGPMPAEETQRIAIDLCGALEAVHTAGVLHRDIKPQNVMRDQNGRIVLMDFGAGRAADDAQLMAGTPLYLAPEVLNGAPASRASDIYSLGVLLFYLVSGSYPIRGASTAEIREAHRGNVPVPVRDVRPDLPVAFADAVAKALEPDPRRRYQTAAEMQRALTGALHTPHPTVRPNRRPLRVAALAAGLVIAAGAAWLASWTSRATAPVGFEARQWVLVVPFENRSGERRLDGVLEQALAHALSASTHLNVLPPDRVDDALRLMRLPPSTSIDRRIAREVALRDGNVRLVLAGSIARIGATFPITVDIVEPASGDVLRSAREEPADEAAIPEAVRRLSSWVRVALGESALQVTQTAGDLQKATTPSLAALRYYSEGMAAARRNAWTTAEPLFRSAVTEDPDFGSAYIWLAWSQVNLGRLNEARAAADGAVERAGRTTDRERHFILGSHWLLRNDAERAASEFEALLSRYPDDYWGQRKMFEAYQGIRSRAEIRDLAVRLADARPNDPSTRLRAAAEVLQMEGLERARPHFARVRELAQAGQTATLTPQEQMFLAFSAVHDFWAQGRIEDASQAAAAIEERLHVEGGDWAIVPAVTFRLGLGQPRAAEALLARMQGGGVKAFATAFTALARGNHDAVARAFDGYRASDLVAPSLLLRTGAVNRAEQLLNRLPNRNVKHVQWSRDEIAVARGRLEQAPRLEEGIRAMRFDGARAFLYAETLAQALFERGDNARGVALLEAQTARPDRVISPAGHLGHLWMRGVAQLADAYRKSGRTQDARRLEADLRARLVLAEADFPLLMELRRREGR